MTVYILLTIILLLLLIALFFLYQAAGNKPAGNDPGLTYKIEHIATEIGRIETAVKTEIAANRMESSDSAKNARQELAVSFKGFEDRLNSLTNALEAKLKEANDTSQVNAKDNRKETKDALEVFKNDFTKSIRDFNTIQKENFLTLLGRQDDQNRIIGDKLEKMRELIEKKITDLQAGNEKKLDEMRATVDEKLQKTLETRLGESFRLVSERLEAVHKGLGDMQQLATGVGDLKRVLANVKTRGVLGEYQLENILEQMLTPEQYAKNVRTKDGSGAMVEFAVKLPGRENTEKTVWLPVDSKFPKEDFELLLDAYDQAVPEMIEERRKSFVKGIRKCAADICAKYIDPPNTTDFAILFLPFESLYAEVLRTPGLFESLQRECRIIITGPTTLSALLNSLQMGFRTLAIEKRSGEVWQLLGAVKTEFGNFGGMLEKTQKKLQEASNVIEQAGVRSRAIERKLRDVQELPKEESVQLLGEERIEDERIGG